MGWMMLWWIVPLVLALALIRYLAVRSPQERPPGESAEEILKRRYAKGEIDHEEYERKLADLRK